MLFSDKPGIAKVKGHNIKLKPDAKVIKCSPYRLPPLRENQFHEEIKNLLT